MSRTSAPARPARRTPAANGAAPNTARLYTTKNALTHDTRVQAVEPRGIHKWLWFVEAHQQERGR